MSAPVRITSDFQGRRQDGGRLLKSGATHRKPVLLFVFGLVSTLALVAGGVVLLQVDYAAVWHGLMQAVR
jgi:hypothetical protein